MVTTITVQNSPIKSVSDSSPRNNRITNEDNNVNSHTGINGTFDSDYIADFSMSQTTSPEKRLDNARANFQKLLVSTSPHLRKCGAEASLFDHHSTEVTEPTGEVGPVHDESTIIFPEGGTRLSFSPAPKPLLPPYVPPSHTNSHCRTPPRPHKSTTTWSTLRAPSTAPSRRQSNNSSYTPVFRDLHNQFSYGSVQPSYANMAGGDLCELHPHVLAQMGPHEKDQIIIRLQGELKRARGEAARVQEQDWVEAATAQAKWAQQERRQEEEMEALRQELHQLTTQHPQVLLLQRQLARTECVLEEERQRLLRALVCLRKSNSPPQPEAVQEEEERGGGGGVEEF